MLLKMTLNQSLSRVADLRYKLKWQASKADMEYYNRNNNVIKDDFEPEFKPYVVFPNSGEITWGYKPGLDKYYSIRSDGDDYMIHYDFTIYGTFYTEFELKHFPFDCQDLVITTKFGRDLYKYEAFNVLPDPQQAKFGKIAPSRKLDSEWKPHPPLIEFTSSKTSHGKNNEPFPLLHIRMKYSRNWWYHVTHYILILLLLTAFSFFTFAIVDLNYVLSFCSTLVLAIVAFQFVISSTVPNLPFLTFIDHYSFMCLAFIAVLCTVHCLFIDDDNEQVVAVVFVALFGVYHAVYGVYAVLAMGKEKKKLCMGGEELGAYVRKSETGYFFVYDPDQTKQILSGQPVQVTATKTK
eukprot:875927_1